MKFNSTKLMLMLVVLIIQACNMPAADTPTQEALIPEENLPDAPITEAPPTEIQHTLVPADLPAVSSGVAADQDSARTSRDNSASGGDRFTFGEYERPFNAIAMDTYFPYLDIQQYNILQDDLWIYTTIVLRSRSAEGTFPGEYALELDNDIDGKGDWLILVSAPASTEWSTVNVQIWQDTNKDVGGANSIEVDKNPGFSDGYETEVFNNGIGNDADAAWARLSPDDQNSVQIAVKRVLVDDDGKYIAGPWAASKLDPAMFDFNDKLTPQEAGAAIRSYTYYPIQLLAELDNACRVSIGGPADANNDLGLCEVYNPQVEGSGDTPSQSGSSCTETACPSGWGFDSSSCSCVLLAPP